MIVYAVTVTDPDGTSHHHYRDSAAALPAFGRAYRAWLCPTGLEWAHIAESIRETEQRGYRVTWRVGEQSYTTPRRGRR